MIYGYARVSTKGQAKDGNSLEDQKKKLTEAGAERIFCEAFTGTKRERPELAKLLSIIEPGDTIVVTKLDRLARSIKYGSDIIEELSSRDVTVNILNLGVMDNTPNGKLMRNIFLAFAEFERDMIVERTREGKEIAKLRKGFTEGRPKMAIPHLEQYIKLYLEGMVNVAEAAKLLNISRQTFARRVDEYTKSCGNTIKFIHNLDKAN